jgi:hypothetical protein
MNCTKTGYMSEKFANEQIKEIKIKSSKSKVPVRTYNCDKCGLWHLTSSPIRFPKIEKVPKEMQIIENQKKIIEDLQGQIKILKIAITKKNITLNKMKNNNETPNNLQQN